MVLLLKKCTRRKDSIKSKKFLGDKIGKYFIKYKCKTDMGKSLVVKHLEKHVPPISTFTKRREEKTGHSN